MPNQPDLCPTCGGPVKIVSTDEGTSSYLPIMNLMRAMASEHWGEDQWVMVPLRLWEEVCKEAGR